MSVGRWVYSALLYGATPFLLGRSVWRSRTLAAHRERLNERLGWVAVRPSQRPCIWLHAVSVGETIAARPLVDCLLNTYPDYDIWITSTTLTGSQTVQRLWGKQVLHSYMGYDLPDVVARLMQRINPAMVLIMETELWPNLYARCQAQSIPLLLINARLSERSFRGYRKLSSLVSETLQAVQLVAARSPQDAHYFQALGVPAERVKITGNIKFDLTLSALLPQQGQVLRQSWGINRPVWVAASTHEGEDEQLLQVFSELKSHYPELLLILVPRHPERFDAVADLCTATEWKVVRRSSGRDFLQADVILGDSMGELLHWYAAADIAFVGGSLVAHGGHNPLEATALKVPVMSGIYVHNFADIYPLLVEVGGAVLVSDSAALQHQLAQWLANQSACQQAGLAGFNWLQQHRGVVGQLMQWIDEVLHEQA